MIKLSKRIKKNMLNAGVMSRIKDIVMHNDYGTSIGTAEWYVYSFLPNHNLELGIAHAYVDCDAAAEVINDNYVGWYTAGWEGNQHFYSIEVC